MAPGPCPLVELWWERSRRRGSYGPWELAWSMWCLLLEACGIPADYEHDKVDRERERGPR